MPADSKDPFLLEVTDLKQWCHCPRIVFYRYCLPRIRPITGKMEEGILRHREEQGREERRLLRSYGLSEGERYFDVTLKTPLLGLSGRLDLLIVQHHNAVVPLPVISLDTSREYTPGAVPDIGRANAKRPNHEEAMLLVSKLLLGIDGVERELECMPVRTRQRYLQRCKQYLQPRVGRPWAS